MTERPTCRALVNGAACGKPVRDNAHLCHPCTGHLTRALADVPALAVEVQTTRLRQSRTGGAPIGGGHGSEKPLPWDDRPVVAAREARQVLSGWALFCGVGSSGTLTELSQGLHGAVGWLRQREEAPQAKRDIEHAVGRLRSTVDRRTDRVYLGRCGSVDYLDETTPDPESVPCPEDLYAHPKAKTVTCRVCEAEHDVDGLREHLLHLVEDQLAHAAWISQALSRLEVPIAEATVRSWAARDRLVQRGVDARKRPLYRIGDALDLVREETARQARTRQEAG